MDRKQSVVTPERYSKGMTFDQYVAYVGTPENLAREAGRPGEARRDWSGFLRERYQKVRLSDTQRAAIQWLASQPGGPAKVLVISEEWSSDCRRDGQTFSASQQPSLAEAPDSNADIMAEFMNVKNGAAWQSIPVAAFYTKDLEYLYHYIEYPAIYHKDPIVYGHIRKPQPGEAPEQTQERGNREFFALQASPFFEIWACAGIDEILSSLHRRLLLGTV